MLIWSFGAELKRVPKGRKANIRCTSCNKDATWHECMVDDTFKLFFVLELYKKTKRVMQCGECLGVCDYYQMFPEEKQLEQEAREQLERETKERQQAFEEKKRKEEEAEREKQDEIDRKRRAEEQKRKDKEVDDELEKIKKKLGK